MRRVLELDALRGLAVIGVLIFHLNPQGVRTQFGMTGIHLFFVLSGYLITSIVLEHVGKPHFFRAFYTRRILRTWPIYYLALFALIAIEWDLPHRASLEALPFYLTFTQRAWCWPGLVSSMKPPAGFLHAFEHTWTLALEEQFYLIWPLAIFLLGRKMLLPMIFAILGFGLWFKTLGYDTWILPHLIGAFALGGLVSAMLADRAWVDRRRVALSASFLAASAVSLLYVRWYYTVPVGWSKGWMAWRDSLQNFAFYTIQFGVVGFVATNAGSRLLFPLRMRELTYLGEISYGIYLYHMPVFWLVGGYQMTFDNPWPVAVSKVAITVAVAALSYSYIEKPFLALKDRFPYEGRPDAEPKPPKVVHQPRMIYTRPGAEATHVDA